MEMIWSFLSFFTMKCFFLFLILPGICSGDPFGNRNFGGGNQDAIEEHDLLQAIRVPFDDPRTQFFDAGLDGFPAYGLREGADIKAHYRLFLPDRLYRDFALLATVKPDRRDISYLFAVVNPLDTLVQFGLKISPSLTSSQHVISLLYTDHSSHLVTQTLTSFEVPLMTKKWNRFALKVVGDNITLYLNCKPHDSQLAMRNPKELAFDTASTLYIGQAGPIIKGNFQGAIQDLKLYGMPGVAEVQCDDSFSNFSSGESSGDTELSQLNDWNDVTYDYPETEDYEDEEIGSSASMPPIPPPPPSPTGDYTALRNLASSLKGSKGEKGELGPRGPPGPNGQKGEPGSVIPILRESGSGSGDEFIPFDPGSSTGKCTCNYTELISKLPDSFHGINGSAGPPGPVGPVGQPGEMGIHGKKGEIGFQGPKGEQGTTGEKGERGLPGLSMAPNAVGFDPDWRPRNLMKDQPKPGPPGLKGDMGEPGSKGAQGEKGERGFQGLPGENGEKGTAGIIGLTGASGKDGSKGDVGLIGPPGPPGIPLEIIIPTKEPAKGEKGEIGLPGRRGRRGKEGPPGPPGEIGIPGWPPRAKPWGRPGTAITGPKGEKGDTSVGVPEGFYNYEIHGPPPTCPTPTCPPGPKGPPGPPGVPGISIVGEPGIGTPVKGGMPALRARLKENRLPNVEGPPGPKGDSSSSSKVVPGAIVFLTKEAMIKMSDLSSLGTIAFVKDEELLFVRVSGGWRPILTGELILGPPPIMDNSEVMSTEPARLMRHPFEASSLVNSIEGPSLRLAALNDPWSGDMHGIRGSDYSCYRQARNANLVGTFRAFLVSYVQNLDSIVKYTDRNLPVLNTKGELLFNSWSDIFQGTGAFLTRPPPIYSFNGRNVIQDFHWPQKMIWHGSATTGVRTKTAYCEAWHSDTPSNVGLASDLLKGQVLGQENISCNHKLIVLCIEIASHNSYRRRRSIPLSPTSFSPSLEFSIFHDVKLLKNLTMEQYTQILDDYDTNSKSNKDYPDF